jgi:hypothetical protein
MRGGRQGHEVYTPYCKNQSVLPWLNVSVSLCLTEGNNEEWLRNSKYYYKFNKLTEGLCKTWFTGKRGNQH